MITIKFYGLLRIQLQTEEILLDQDNITVLNALEICQQKLQNDLLVLLSDDGKTANQGTIILLNGRNVKHLQELATKIRKGDVISIFPPGGGG